MVRKQGRDTLLKRKRGIHVGIQQAAGYKRTTGVKLNLVDVIGSFTRHH